MIFLYTGRPTDFFTDSFFWTSRFQPAEAKYMVFGGVTKTRIGNIAVAKMEKPRNHRKISWPGTDVGPQEAALFLPLGQRNTLAG